MVGRRHIMDQNEQKLAYLKDAIDKRLKTLYAQDEEAKSNETKTLEYLMCIIEADANDD